LASSLIGHVPGSETAANIWQTRVAKFAQIVLYGLMLGLPLAGWLLLSAKEEVIPFFGRQLPANQPTSLDGRKQVGCRLNQ